MEIQFRYRLQYDNFYTDFQSGEEFDAAMHAKGFLETNGFKFLSWSASEGLLVTAAWREDKASGNVFALAGAKPMSDGGFPDPFNHPTNLYEACEVSLYQRPFKAADISWPGDEPYEWVMDGSPPSSVNDENAERFSLIFRTVEEAVKWCDWLVQHEALHRQAAEFFEKHRRS